VNVAYSSLFLEALCLLQEKRTHFYTFIHLFILPRFPKHINMDDDQNPEFQESINMNSIHARQNVFA